MVEIFFKLEEIPKCNHHSRRAIVPSIHSITNILTGQASQARQLAGDKNIDTPRKSFRFRINP